MITEDYVSFEIAKLLKEKGFDVSKTNAYFPFVYYSDGKMDFYDDDKPSFVCEAVSLQMAMKWLRIEHNIHIEPHIVKTKCSYGYMPNYIDLKRLEPHFPFKEIDFCDLEKYVCITYDKACEVTLKYCLENLI